MNEAALDEFCASRSLASGKKQLAVVLAGHLPRRLCETLLTGRLAGGSQGRGPEPSGPRPPGRRRQAAAVPVTGTLGFEKAEVTAGGVALDEVDSRTMHSKRVPDLYLAGEMLDLDGPIGGYNFQAAWSTGWLAGQVGGEPRLTVGPSFLFLSPHGTFASRRGLMLQMTVAVVAPFASRPWNRPVTFCPPIQRGNNYAYARLWDWPGPAGVRHSAICPGGRQAQAPTPATSSLDADKLAPGVFTGTVMSVPDSDRILSLNITYQKLQLKSGQNLNRSNQQLQRKYNHIMQLQNRLMHPSYRHNPFGTMQQLQNALVQFQVQSARAQANMFHVVNAAQKVDFQAEENVKVRIKALPEQFDDKGNIKTYTKEELAELKGKDKNLPGYESSLDKLQNGQIVQVTLGVHKKPKPVVAPCSIARGRKGQG